MQQPTEDGSEGHVNHAQEAIITVACVTCSWELGVDLCEGVVVDTTLGEDVPVDSLPKSAGGEVSLICRDCAELVRRLRATGIDADLNVLKSSIDMATTAAERRGLPPEKVIERHLVSLYLFSADLREMYRTQFFQGSTP